MPDKECPECEAELLIIPMKALHVGSIECEDCGASILWRSPRGVRDFEFVDKDEE